MGSEFVNQDNAGINGKPSASESFTASDHISDVIDADFTPAPTVYDFWLALQQRINDYKGGYKGVWKAISQNLKFQYPTDNTGNGKILPRLTSDTFRKQVERLHKNEQTDEKMTIKGNILLMMNILEILEIKSIKDILGDNFLKPDIQSLIIEANVNSETILEKMDALENTIALSMRNKPRIPKIKICHDWEQILKKMEYITYMNSTTQITNPSNQNSIKWNFNNFFNYYANNYSLEIQIAINICTLLNEYKEYFPQDTLLHKFLDDFIYLSSFDYIKNYKLIASAPLFLFYFFLLFQKRFINCFLSKKKDSNKYSPFYHAEFDKNSKENKENEEDEENEIKKINNILDGKSLIEYISLQNNEMCKLVKMILLLYKDNMIDVKALKDIHKLIYDVIIFFILIYNTNTNYDRAHFLSFMEKIKSLNDLYNQLSLGKPFIYYISKQDIEMIIDFKQRLETLYSKILRFDEG